MKSSLLARALAAGVVLALVSPSAAAPSDPTSAFEKAFATSLYIFDACGDQLTGRMFRKVLADKLAQCKLPPEATARYRQRTALLQRKSRDAMDKLIEDHGGLPNTLEGMTSTCHGTQSGEDYRKLRERLEAYSQGQGSLESIIPASCDADEMTP